MVWDVECGFVCWVCSIVQGVMKWVKSKVECLVESCGREVVGRGVE